MKIIGPLAFGLAGIAAWTSAAAPASGPVAVAAMTTERLSRGDGRFTFDGWAGPPIRVWTHVPPRAGADTPIVIVMHGRGRDADRYRDEWKGLAASRGFILAVPEFDDRRFPGANAYNHGWFRETDGTPRPRAQWSFSAIEPLFDEIKRRSGSTVERYALYGHSAGAQFVHRFILFTPEARYHAAVTANAGSYAFPRLDIDYPFGLRGTPVDEAGLKAALGKPVVVLLGTADIDPRHPSLPRGPNADAQGPHRLARGHAFHAAGRRTAGDMGVPFGWVVRQAPGIGHENGRMATVAAPLLVIEK